MLTYERPPACVGARTLRVGIPTETPAYLGKRGEEFLARAGTEYEGPTEETRREREELAGILHEWAEACAVDNETDAVDEMSSAE